MGRIATILFAHKLGKTLEPECKMYRLTADVFNDTAMIMDCLSPAFPKPARVLVLGFSSVLRSLCGVCAGSSKASLSAHFAQRGNLGELNAVSGFPSFFTKLVLLLLLLRCCFIVDLQFRLTSDILKKDALHLHLIHQHVPYPLLR